MFILFFAIFVECEQINYPLKIIINESSDEFWPLYKINRDRWYVTANSEQTTAQHFEGPITNIIDGNHSTMWHSRFDNEGIGGHDDRENSSDPFQIVIDLSKITKFTAFSYMPRKEGFNGKFRHYEFYLAQTLGELNSKISNKDFLVKGDISHNNFLSTLINFNTEVAGQYVALLSVDHDGYGSCVEFNLYNVPLKPTGCPKNS